LIGVLLGMPGTRAKQRSERSALTIASRSPRGGRADGKTVSG
jgi:hypothetical protein